MHRYVWLNSKIVPVRSACIDFDDEGVLYGQGLFETMRVYHGVVFLLEEHLKRLVRCCPVLGIAVKKPRILHRAVTETIHHNKIKDGALRLSVWKKKSGIGMCAFIKQHTFCPSTAYRKGFRAHLCTQLRQNEFSPLSRVKSLNYYLQRSALRQAQRHGADEAILVNTAGDVCEGARSNIFIVKKDRVITPLLMSGCLAGITRATLLKICRAARIPIRQQKCSPRMLQQADELFCTNSLLEIMPITRLGNHRIGTGFQGSITSFLHERYKALVAKELT